MSADNDKLDLDGELLHEVMRQPRISDIALTTDDGITTFRIPRDGFSGRALALLGFAIIWIIFSGFLGTLTVIDFWKGTTSGVNVGTMACFFLMGLLLLAHAIQVAWQKIELMATENSLVFFQSGPFKQRRFEWHRNNMMEIKIANAQVQGEGILLQLQVVKRDGQRDGLLTGRPDQELYWMATVLREFYGMMPQNHAK